MATYADRDRVLFRMGFADYTEYLSSDLWRRIRTKVMGDRGGACRLCGERATEVHHVDYDEETLRGLSLTGLALLCSGCHESVEFDKRGKRTLDAVTKEYERRLKCCKRTSARHARKKTRRRKRVKLFFAGKRGKPKESLATRINVAVVEQDAHLDAIVGRGIIRV